MEMSASGAAGRSDVADGVAALDDGTDLHGEAAQVPVARRQAEVVFDDHEVAIVAAVRRRFDEAIRRRVDRLPTLGGDIEALMEAALTGKRIGTAAEIPCEPAVGRPD